MDNKKKSIVETHPEIAKQWHPTKNGNLKPNDVTHGSNRKVWWKCDVEDDHEWESTICNRSFRDDGCVCCSGRKVVMSNCLAVLHPEIVKYWHPTKNGETTPFNICRGSDKKFWWKCDVADDHEWEEKINHTLKDFKCACCSGRKAVLSNCLATIHPEISKDWHPTKNGNLTPYNFVPGSNKKIWWKCDVADDHEWLAMINNRTCKNLTGCPCCGKHKVVLSNCLATTHPDISKEWHPTKNGKLIPYDVTYGSNKKVWWIGECNHEWDATVSDRTHEKGCPICKESRGEKKIKLFLKNNNINFETQKKFDRCKNTNKLPFDVYVPEHNLLIEYDGELHYKSSEYFGGEEKLKSTQLNDQIKNEYCKNNNIPLLRIPYWELKNIEKILINKLH